MWMAIGLLSFVAWVVLLIMGLIAVFKKTGKAKKYLFPALACFVITMIAVAADPSNTKEAADEKKETVTETEPATKKEEDSKPTSVNESKQETEPEKEKVNANGLTDQQQQELYRNSIISESSTYIQLKVRGTLSDERYESATKLMNKFLADYTGADKDKLKVLVDAVNANDLKAAKKQYIALDGEDFDELHKEPAKATAKTEQKKADNPPTISKSEFEKIKNGMTYKQVVEIIGGPGEVLSEAGEQGTEFYTVMYTYEGEGSIGANANFMFQGGKLQAKAQFGLE